MKSQRKFNREVLIETFGGRESIEENSLKFKTDALDYKSEEVEKAKINLRETFALNFEKHAN